MAQTIPDDPRARSAQIALLRAAGESRRFALARSLSASTIAFARDAIALRHPDWNEREIGLEFVRVHYGAELAERVRTYLRQRER